METITSRNNPLIKQVAKLCASTAERRRQGVFVLEGVRLCFDVLQTDLAIRQVFVTSGCQSRHPDAVAAILAAGRDAYLISDPVADKLAATGHTQGIFCVCEQPAASGGLQAGGHYILLENLQDPSNVGAILRTAEAFGLDGVLLAGGADPYGEKCIRASMGSILRMPLYLYDDIEQAAAACTAFHLPMLALVPDAQARPITRLCFEHGFVIAVGNEGNGLSEAAKAQAAHLVTIPMQGATESLNASAAAAVAMWELMRGGISGG